MKEAGEERSELRIGGFEEEMKIGISLLRSKYLTSTLGETWR